jgi:hypothetical protein
MSATVDTGRLKRDMDKLTRGLDRAATDTARATAEETARTIAGNVPVRTGALRATVAATKTGKGYGVTYGGGLRYAWPQEKRSRAVNRALNGVDRRFLAAAQTAASIETSHI